MERNMDNVQRGVAALSSKFPDNGLSSLFIIFLKIHVTKIIYHMLTENHKQWSLKDLRSKPIFQQLETDAKKRAAQTKSTMSDLDKALDWILHLEDDKPSVVPVQTNNFTRLRSVEQELKPNPPKPYYNQQVPTNRFAQPPPVVASAPGYQPPERKPAPVNQEYKPHVPQERKPTPIYQPPRRVPDHEPPRVNKPMPSFVSAREQFVLQFFYFLLDVTNFNWISYIIL